MSDDFKGNPNGGTGRCMCGAITYRVAGPMRPIIFCHCDQCRHMTGGIWAATGCYRDQLEIQDPGKVLKWYRSSDHARRGFCSECGSSLFFQSDNRPQFAGVTAGTLDQPTGLKVAAHIFVQEAGDWYELDDKLPRHTDMNHGLNLPPRDDAD